MTSVITNVTRGKPRSTCSIYKHTQPYILKGSLVEKFPIYGFSTPPQHLTKSRTVHIAQCHIFDISHITHHSHLFSHITLSSHHLSLTSHITSHFSLTSLTSHITHHSHQAHLTSHLTHITFLGTRNISLRCSVIFRSRC